MLTLVELASFAGLNVIGDPEVRLYVTSSPKNGLPDFRLPVFLTYCSSAVLPSAVGVPGTLIGQSNLRLLQLTSRRLSWTEEAADQQDDHVQIVAQSFALKCKNSAISFARKVQQSLTDAFVSDILGSQEAPQRDAT